MCFSHLKKGQYKLEETIATITSIKIEPIVPPIGPAMFDARKK